MDRIRLFAMGTILMFTLAMLAQQTTTKSGGAHDLGIPAVEGHLKVLTEKLNLTGDQQTKVRPILQDLQDATQKLVRDESISREQRLAKVRAQREKADKRIREILNDDQRKRLDQLEREPHPELHGDVQGETSPPARPQL